MLIRVLPKWYIIINGVNKDSCYLNSIAYDAGKNAPKGMAGLLHVQNKKFQQYNNWVPINSRFLFQKLFSFVFDNLSDYS